MTVRAGLRLVFRLLPVAGVAVIGHASVVSIGGDIRPLEFLLGLVLIGATFLAGLVPEDGPG